MASAHVICQWFISVGVHTRIQLPRQSLPYPLLYTAGCCTKPHSSTNVVISLDCTERTLYGRKSFVNEHENELNEQ